MAGAIIIACGIGILLLILAGYVIVSGTLASGDMIASAQKDMVQEKDEQVHTAIQISGAGFTASVDPLHNLTFDLQNTGSEPIFNFNQTDMFISISQGPPERYSFNGFVSGNTYGSNKTKKWGYRTINPDTIHPYMLDPGEKMTVDIGDYIITVWPHPIAVINVTTSNGITAVERSTS